MPSCSCCVSLHLSAGNMLIIIFIMISSVDLYSVQHMGCQVSDRVRLKCIELLYGWSQLLSHEPKVKEAYEMLKRQGIIKYDPVHIDKVDCLGHSADIVLHRKRGIVDCHCLLLLVEFSVHCFMCLYVLYY